MTFLRLLKTGCNYVVLPILFIVVSNIVQQSKIVIVLEMSCVEFVVLKLYLIQIFALHK